MKNILLTLLLFSTTALFAQQDKSYNLPYQMDYFEDGKDYYVFGHNVKLRKGPSTDEEVVMLLSIGDQVEIVDKQDVLYKIGGYEANWFEVKSGNKTGFVVGALLAEQGLDFEGQRFLFNKTNTGISIRALQDKGAYSELKFEPRGSATSVRPYDNRGLAGIKNILYIDYQGECCGCEMGGSYIFYDGKKLIDAIDVLASGDGGYYEEESVTFPAEKEGLSSNKVIFHNRSGEVMDEDTNWEIETISKRELTWEGDAFYPENFRRGNR